MSPDDPDALLSSLSSTERFSSRVADYVGFRPGYPDSILDTLADSAGLSSDAVVADIGSGTGISAELLLPTGCTVHAVEPNPAMRAAAEERLRAYPNFHSVVGTAEATTLPDRSCDLIVSAQAFHWFDIEAAKSEFRRILKPEGQVALIWNIRLPDATPFLREYEELVQDFGVGYQQVNALTASPARVDQLFRGGYRRFYYDNEQYFDFVGLRGRLLSSSYAPPGGHPRHEPMISALRRIFDEHAEGGKVRFLYRTDLFLGKVQVAP